MVMRTAAMFGQLRRSHGMMTSYPMMSLLYHAFSQKST
jgi:hypothetical protein